MSAPHSYTLAAEVAKRLGIVRTGLNIKTIELALLSDSEDNGWDLNYSAEQIVRCARAQRQRGVWIRRFWFEDAGWNHDGQRGPTNALRGGHTEESRARLAKGADIVLDNVVSPEASQ